MKDSTLIVIIGIIIIFLIILELNRSSNQSNSDSNSPTIIQSVTEPDINFPNWWYNTSSTNISINTHNNDHHPYHPLGPGGTQHLLGPGGQQKK